MYVKILGTSLTKIMASHMANGGIIFISIDDRTCNVVVRHCGQLI